MVELVDVELEAFPKTNLTSQLLEQAVSLHI